MDKTLLNDQTGNARRDQFGNPYSGKRIDALEFFSDAFQRKTQRSGWGLLLLQYTESQQSLTLANPGRYHFA